MTLLTSLLLLMVPFIVAGTLNMIFVKSGVLSSLHTPMDGGRTLADGRRIFGDNKTWKGFWGMTAFTALTFAAYAAAAQPGMIALPADGAAGLLIGALFGFLYVLFELPNSYCKRRLDIAPGGSAVGPLRPVFAFVDQADSAVGVALVLPLVTELGPIEAGLFVLVGAAVHYLVAIALYMVGLKNQI